MEPIFKSGPSETSTSTQQAIIAQSIAHVPTPNGSSQLVSTANSIACVNLRTTRSTTHASIAPP